MEGDGVQHYCRLIRLITGVLQAGWLYFPTLSRRGSEMSEPLPWSPAGGRAGWGGGSRHAEGCCTHKGTHTPHETRQHFVI